MEFEAIILEHMGKDIYIALEEPWEQRRGMGTPPLQYSGLRTGAKKKTKPLKICFLFEEIFVIIKNEPSVRRNAAVRTAFC